MPFSKWGIQEGKGAQPGTPIRGRLLLWSRGEVWAAEELGSSACRLGGGAVGRKDTLRTVLSEKWRDQGHNPG